MRPETPAPPPAKEDFCELWRPWRRAWLLGLLPCVAAFVAPFAWLFLGCEPLSRWLGASATNLSSLILLNLLALCPALAHRRARASLSAKAALLSGKERWLLTAPFPSWSLRLLLLGLGGSLVEAFAVASDNICLALLLPLFGVPTYVVYFWARCFRDVDTTFEVSRIDVVRVIPVELPTSVDREVGGAYREHIPQDAPEPPEPLTERLSQLVFKDDSGRIFKDIEVLDFDLPKGRLELWMAGRVVTCEAFEPLSPIRTELFEARARTRS